MSLIKDDQPRWDEFIKDVIAIPQDNPNDSEVYFSLDSILMEALEALRASMEAPDSDIAQLPLEEFGAKYLHLGQS